VNLSISEKMPPEFTELYYRNLLQIAKKNYNFTSFCNYKSEESIILWRHDVDFSVHRSLELAKIEQDEGVRSTFFIYLHSEFYNVFELEVTHCIREIIKAGHEIGVHFDPAYYEGKIKSYEDLEDLLSYEKRLLEEIFKIEVKVFSFHNPDIGDWLKFDDEIIAGMVNTYSHHFKNNFGYCSDSNGYWRYEQLVDVLEKREQSQLQVLTHPGWWTPENIPPMERVYRAVLGRSNNVLFKYHQTLEKVGRLNCRGGSDSFLFIKSKNNALFWFYERLWVESEFSTLFCELYVLHQKQINELCKLFFVNIWNVDEREVNKLLRDNISGCGWLLFQAAFKAEWDTLVDSDDEHRYTYWRNATRQKLFGLTGSSDEEYKKGIIWISGMIQRFYEWGCNSKVGYGGLAEAGEYDSMIKIHSCMIDGSSPWNDFMQIHFPVKNVET
jgi:hypothetical protein